MAEQRYTPIGPWPLGLDNVHSVRHQVFQIPDQGQPPARLAAATDVDLNDEGWVRTRQPSKTVEALTSGRGLWSVNGQRYVQDGDVLRAVGNPAALVSGLVSRASLCDFGGLTYVTDGVTHHELDGTTVRTWGCQIPTVALSAVAGSTFQPGTYLVQASFSDARGNEHGTSDVAAITLATASDIRATVTGSTPQTLKVNLYLGLANQAATTFATQVDVTGSSTQTVLPVPTTDADPPRTRLMQGPPNGLAGLFSWRGHLAGWRDNVVFLAEASEPHLWHQEAVWQFSGAVRSAVGFNSGAWVGTSAGMVWVSGDDRFSVIPEAKTHSPVLAGSYIIEGWKIPRLQVSDPVALFVSRDGLLVGLPSGTLINLTEDRYHFNTGDRASFGYCENTRQLLIAVT